MATQANDTVSAGGAAKREFGLGETETNVLMKYSGSQEILLEEKFEWLDTLFFFFNRIVISFW